MDPILRDCQSSFRNFSLEGTSPPSSTAAPLAVRVEQFIAKLVADPGSASAIDGKKIKVTTEDVRKVAVALRDLQVGDVIVEDDFKIRSIAVSTAPKDAMLAIVGAKLTMPIAKGSIIKRSEITNIPGSVASYS